MPTAVPPLPAGIRNESLEVGAAPVIRHFLEKLGLPGLFDRYLPRLRGRRRDVPTPTVLCVLLSNLLLARQPLYGVAAWAAGFVPEHLGLLPEQLALLNSTALRSDVTLTVKRTCGDCIEMQHSP